MWRRKPKKKALYLSLPSCRRAQRKAAKPPPKRVRKVSKWMALMTQRYLLLRATWIVGKVCVNCGVRARQCHHKRGRGRFLLDVSTWLPVCARCHRLIHDNPAWATAQGYMERR